MSIEFFYSKYSFITIPRIITLLTSCEGSMSIKGSLNKFVLNIMAIGTALLLTVDINPTQAQIVVKEPRVDENNDPVTYVDKGLKQGLGFNIYINNFGFGVGGHYRRVVSPMMEATTSLEITAIRDASEQTFNLGQQIVPNKYKRVLAVPLKFGLKRRFFARQIDDNFRLYAATSFGPSVAFALPYFRDYTGDDIRQTSLQFYEPNYDFFRSWSNVEVKWGITGDMALGVDFGQFKKLQSLHFGVSFFYYPEEIQVMQPYKPGPGHVPNDPSQFNRLPFYEPQDLFVTPTISMVFGNMW